MSDFIEQNLTPNVFDTTGSWSLLSPIEKGIKEKIESTGTPLKEWNVSIYRGILTGFNDAFIIDEEKKNELISLDPKSAEIIRPILRGMDIKKFNVSFANNWLINTHNGVRQDNVQAVNAEKYPAIFNYLCGFKSILEARLDKGNLWYNLRNCAYIFEFEKQKIVWQELSRTGSSFCFIEEPMYLSNTAYALTGLDKQALLFLTAALNSYASLFYLEIVYNKLDETGWRWLKNAVEKIPLPSDPRSKEISDLVELVQHKKTLRENTVSDERKLRMFIYNLYKLNKEEIDFLENKFSKKPSKQL